MDLLYFAYAPKKSLGVRKKVNNIVTAFNNNNVESALIIKESVSLKDSLSFIALVRVKCPKIVIIRNPGTKMFYLIPFILWLRVTGIKVIIDVPTPLSIGISETLSDQLTLKSIIGLLPVVASTPLINILATRVLHYGKESYYFSIFSQKKTVLIANGYNVKSVDANVEKTWKKGGEIKILAVAAVASWHGFDRVIKGLASYANCPANPKVTFSIVGDGPELENLKNLVTEFELEAVVNFLGIQQGAALQKLYDTHHIGVGTIGGFRKNIDSASDLKSREYASAGLPIISSMKDVDFPQNLSFFHMIENSDKELDIKEVVSFYSNLYSPELTKEVRQYAENVVSYDNKVMEMIDKC